MTWLQPPRQYEGAPAEHVQAMSLKELLKRSELSSTIDTPGKDTYYKEKELEDTKLLRKVCPSDEEESDEDTEEEEVKDDDNKAKDPDFEGEKRPSRKRPATNGAGSGKRGTSEDGPRDQRPSEMPPAKRREHERAKAEKKAEEDAAGAVELEAAEADFKRTLAEKAWSLAKKAKYVAVVGEVKAWAKDGGAKATAAKWIRCLTSEGKDRLTPSRVRTNYTRTSPGPA